MSSNGKQNPAAHSRQQQQQQPQPSNIYRPTRSNTTSLVTPSLSRSLSLSLGLAVRCPYSTDQESDLPVGVGRRWTARVKSVRVRPARGRCVVDGGPRSRRQTRWLTIDPVDRLTVSRSVGFVLASAAASIRTHAPSPAGSRSAARRCCCCCCHCRRYCH